MINAEVGGMRWSRGLAASTALLSTFISAAPTPATPEMQVAIAASAIRTAVAASQWVVTADGTRLATDVFLPLATGWGPWPVVIQRTPYGRGGATGSTCESLAFEGFACIAQDVRGTGDSTGSNTVFRDDHSDGQATIEWVARQWWCNGSVATFGASALGMTQYALAPGAPDQLKCLVPMVATADFFHHAAFWGGAIRYSLTHPWLEGQGALAFYDEMRSHRTWDAWWEQAAIMPHVGDIKVPGFHVGGWYDIFLQGTLDAFTAAQNRGGAGALGSQHLVVGPWVHTGVGTAQAGELTYPSNAANFVDVLAAVRDWYDHWLRGKTPAVEQWPAVHVYLMGAVGEAGAPGNVWLDLSAWPPPAVTTAFYLGTGRSLGIEQLPTGEIELRSDPGAPVPTVGGGNLFESVDGQLQGIGPLDQRPIEGRSDVLVFSTPVLEEPVTVMGRVRCLVWVRPDTKDFDIAVRLADVYPDGRSMLVADGIQRARFRCGDDRECLADPGGPIEMTVDLWSTALAFNRGHRIRILISGSNWPRFEVNRNDGGDLNGAGAGVMARPVVLVGSSFPSRLELPVLRVSQFPRRHLSRRRD